MSTSHLNRLFHLGLLVILLTGCGMFKPKPTITSMVPPLVNPVPFEPKNFKIVDCPKEMMPTDMDIPRDMAPKIQCANLAVPLDRQRADSPKIEIAIAIVKTASDAPKPDPILVVIGNPGYGLIIANALPFLMRDLFEQRDFIVVDQRGTGFANPSFECEELSSLESITVEGNASLQEVVDRHVEASKTCANRIRSEAVDLTQYTTATFAADMEDVRQALGISQWNIYTLLDGSRLALTMMRDYPQGIRSVVMDSAVPLQANPVVEMGNNALLALDSFFQRCAEDEQCNDTYPHLKDTFYKLLDKIDIEPISIDVSNLDTGNRYTVELNSERLITFMLNQLNAVESNDTLPEIPRMINQLMNGETEAAARLMARPDQRLPTSAMGQWLACNEEISYNTLDQAKSANGNIGKYLLQYFNSQAEGNFKACEPWKAPGTPDYENMPVSSSIPSLLLTGEFAWTESPVWAEQTAKTLFNSTVVIFSGAGQAVTAAQPSMECSQKIITAFINTPTKKTDTTCATINRFRWITLR